MTGFYLLAPTLITIFLSYVVVRAGAIALMMTGMTQDRARFQALSAFTRTGFYSRDAELVVNHPQRKRIISWMMILGNAGLVAVIVTATATITTSQGYQLPITIAAIITGALVFYIYGFTDRSGLAKKLDNFIENRFVRAHVFEEGTTEDLLHLMEGNGLVRITITQGSPFINKTLVEANTPGNEFWIVGIERGRDWISLPRSREIIKEGDRLVVYGELDDLRQIFRVQ